MMRFVWGVASLDVAIECAERASGITPQTFVTPEYLGAWWFVAACWLIAALRAWLGWIWES